MSLQRPHLSSLRLSLSEQGKVVRELRAPFKDGTTHSVFDPLVFIGMRPVAGSTPTHASAHLPRCAGPGGLPSQRDRPGQPAANRTKASRVERTPLTTNPSLQALLLAEVDGPGVRRRGPALRQVSLAAQVDCSDHRCRRDRQDPRALEAGVRRAGSHACPPTAPG